MKKLKEFNKVVEKFLQNEIYLPIISDFLDWFWDKIKIHFWKNNNEKLKFNKWDIYFVKLWKNIWTELNKNIHIIKNPLFEISIFKNNFL